MLRLNNASWEVLRAQRAVRLVQAKEKVQKTRIRKVLGEGRRRIIRKLSDFTPQTRRPTRRQAYVLFNDATLRDMARVAQDVVGLLGLRGVGEKKFADLGQRFLEEIVTYCGRIVWSWMFEHLSDRKNTGGRSSQAYLKF